MLMLKLVDYITFVNYRVDYLDHLSYVSVSMKTDIMTNPNLASGYDLQVKTTKNNNLNYLFCQKLP